MLQLERSLHETMPNRQGGAAGRASSTANYGLKETWRFLVRRDEASDLRSLITNGRGGVLFQALARWGTIQHGRDLSKAGIAAIAPGVEALDLGQLVQELA